MKVSRNAVLGLSIALALGAGIGQAGAQETTPAPASSAMHKDTMKSDMHKDHMKADDSMSSGDSMKSDTGAKPAKHKKKHKKAMTEPASSSSSGH